MTCRKVFENFQRKFLKLFVIPQILGLDLHKKKKNKFFLAAQANTKMQNANVNANMQILFTKLPTILKSDDANATRVANESQRADVVNGIA